jgi:hypothetical protein
VSVFQALARRMSRNDSSVRIPRTPQISLHQGELAAVDNNTNTVHFTHNGTGVVIPGVPVMLSYTADHTPTAGDIAVLQMHGTDPVIIGHLVVPTNVVSP